MTTNCRKLTGKSSVGFERAAQVTFVFVAALVFKAELGGQG